MMEKVKLIEELFQKKLGIVIKSAREIRKQSIEVCANAIGVEASTFLLYENGEIAPSLPELEVLAYFLEVPIQHFFNSTLEEKKKLFSKITRTLINF